MAHSETFYVSKTDNQIKRIEDNPISYFNPDWKSPNLGKAKFTIEVFSNSNHQKTAEQIKDMIDQKGLSDKFFSIKVECK